jgi:Trk K+ transport system NAD-binding subunit
MAINKKITIGVLIVIILAFGGIIGWVILQKEKIPSEEIMEEETIIEKQLRELEALRKETQPLTEKETEKQLEELEKLRLQ